MALPLNARFRKDRATGILLGRLAQGSGSALWTSSFDCGDIFAAKVQRDREVVRVNPRSPLVAAAI
jgi:hypothetical protein